MATREQPSRRWQWRHIVLWLVLTGVVCWWRGPAYRRVFEPEFYAYSAALFVPDFFQEWASARNRFNGLPIYTPHEITVERYLGLRRNPADRYFIEVNAHPPTAVLLGFPFAGLNFVEAFSVWNFLSLLALAVSAWLIVSHLELPISPWDLLPAVALLLLCQPFWHQMVHGQLNLVLLLLLTGVWAADRTGRPCWAGVLLGTATAIKLFPAFLFLYFVLRGRWRAVAAGFLALGALSGLTVLLLGPQTYRQYFLEVLPQTALWRSDWRNMSLSGLWFKLFDPSKEAPLIEIHPLLWSPSLAWTGMACSLVALTAVLCRVVPRLRAPKDSDLAFSLCTIAMLLVSPITWDHYLLLLVLPLAVLWQHLPTGRMGREVLVLLLFVFWWPQAMVVEHGLILLDAAHPRNDPGRWIAMPLETLTALSVYCYALVVLFALTLWAAGRDRPAAAAA